MRPQRPYSNPYLAGVSLGLVLLAAYVVMGRGLGASGAFASSAAGLTAAISPPRADSSAYLAGYLQADGGPWRNWLLWEIAGVLVGGFLSAWLAGRLRVETERGPRISDGTRLAAALAGGVLMGVGAVFARGCTSGQALTGGALLSVGSWGFMLMAFAGAYLVAPLVRRAWT
ncbi:MAG: YeeE/YedE family protein [Gemmatimonadetes bacterium]|nr:YeeE/YedE family protein [Gemmatimonadota bacterium]MBI3566765.1 YeeE/YedE family protein [Gemmatimonadota bacterium]